MAGNGSGGDGRRAGLRDFSRSLPMALLKAREAVMDRFRPILRAHDVTEQQWRVLRALEDGSEQEVSRLAERCRLLGPSLTRILRALEDRGLVIRRNDPGDLRRAFIRIAEDGMTVIGRVAPLSETEYAAIEAAFGAGRLAELHRELDALTAALARGGEGDAAR